MVFDMDGVILDSYQTWERVLRELFAVCDRPWSDLDQSAFAGGDNSRQWASILRDVIGLPLDEDDIVDRVVRGLIRHYAEELTLMPGAATAVARLARRYPLGLASSSPRSVIAFVLEQSGLAGFFAAWASSDDVARGKPAPDVYLRVCNLLGCDPKLCVAVEDSGVGIQAARAAGLKVLAIPRRSSPVDPDALGLAAKVLPCIARLDSEAIEEVLAV